MLEVQEFWVILVERTICPFCFVFMEFLWKWLNQQSDFFVLFVSNDLRFFYFIDFRSQCSSDIESF